MAQERKEGLKHIHHVVISNYHPFDTMYILFLLLDDIKVKPPTQKAENGKTFFLFY